MKIMYSDRHRVHAGQREFHRGELVPCFEKPLFVLEGGYAVAEIGHNVARVLRSFDASSAV